MAKGHEDLWAWTVSWFLSVAVLKYSDQGNLRERILFQVMVAGKSQQQASEVAGHVTSTVKSEEQPTFSSVQVPSPYIFQSGNGATVVGVSSHLSEGQSLTGVLTGGSPR